VHGLVGKAFHGLQLEVDHYLLENNLRAALCSWVDETHYEQRTGTGTQL
jgi:hypothetical protein